MNVRVKNASTHDSRIKDYLTDFEKFPCGIAIVKNDEFHTLVEANSTFYKMIGYTKEDFFKLHQSQMGKIMLDHHYEAFKEPLENKDIDFEWDLRIRKHNGDIAWIHDHAHYNSSMDEFFLVYTDISDKLVSTVRDLSYEAFQTRNTILGYMNMYTGERVIISDYETSKVIYISMTASKMLGFEKEDDWKGKNYVEIAFGSKDNIHPSYYEEVNDRDFTIREYYNDFHKMYVNVKSKVVYVSSLNKKMRFDILTDITAQKELESKIEVQMTLRKCVDTLFIAGAKGKEVKDAYTDVLTQIKKYYKSDRAFFYKFKSQTHEVDEFVEVCDNNLEKVDFNTKSQATMSQLKLMNELGKCNLVYVKDILANFDKPYKKNLEYAYNKYKIDSFISLSVTNPKGDIIAFMGVTNPMEHKESKSLMELLSRSICMFIEYNETQQAREEALMLESVSKTNLVEKTAKVFLNLTNIKENIEDTLDDICTHYDADFALVLLKRMDGSCSVSYVGGENIPDLRPFELQGNEIMKKWTSMFGVQPQFASSVDFEALNTSRVKNALIEKFGIHNFIVAPMLTINGNLKGLVFVNNFKFLNRSHLMVNVVAKDISNYLERYNMQIKSQLDPATNLTNKVATQNQVTQMLEIGIKGTLFIIDIDDLKGINDKLGHQTGDKAIIDFANILKRIFRNTDIIGRIGGDEFMVFSPELIDEDLIINKAKQLIDSSTICYEYDGVAVEGGLSIGICSTLDYKYTFDMLYQKADYALYKAKKQGKHQYQIYVPTAEL